MYIWHWKELSGTQSSQYCIWSLGKSLICLWPLILYYDLGIGSSDLCNDGWCCWGLIAFLHICIWPKFDLDGAGDVSSTLIHTCDDALECQKWICRNDWVVYAYKCHAEMRSVGATVCLYRYWSGCYILWQVEREWRASSVPVMDFLGLLFVCSIPAEIEPWLATNFFATIL